MRDGYQSRMLSTSLIMEQAVRVLREHPRKAAFAKYIFILLAMVLWLPILTLGQSQSQTQPAGQSQSAAETQSQASTPKTSHTQSQTTSASEPQMQSMAPPQETLADAAKRAKAQKPKSESGKVFTEDDVSGLPGHGVSVVGDGLVGGSSSPETGNSYAGSGSSSTANDEKYWRGRARQIHDQMDSIDQQISKLQEDIKKNGAIGFDPSTGLRQNVIIIDDKNAQVKSLERQKQSLQNQLDSLADEGRKAGADSGWFR
jgi:hypothetical protein